MIGFLTLFLTFAFSYTSPAGEIRAREEIASIKYYDEKLDPDLERPKPRPEKLIRYSADFSQSEWMKEIDGTRKIFTLTIPGTHETCALYGGPLTQCQDWSLEEQLLNGVRYIDIRCRHINDVFMIHHGIIYQKLSFGTGVRDVCINFLKDHPSEFIFMQVKEEYKSTDNTRTFEETMKSYIETFEDYFYLDEGSPTLDKVRGKIVLLRRFASSILPMGNYLRFQDNAIFTSTTSITARIQDCYNVPTLFDRPKKWNYVTSLFEEVLKNTDEDKLFVNFGSGSSALCYPYSVADYVTPRIGNFVQNEQPNTFLGVILFDFIDSYYNNVIYYVAIRNYINDFKN